MDMTKERYIRRATIKYGDRYGYELLPNDIIRGTILKIICKKHGIFEIEMRSFLVSTTTCGDVVGSCSAKCSGCLSDINKYNRVVAIKQIVHKSKAKYGTKFDYSLIDYGVDISAKQTILCSKHGKLSMVMRTHYHSGSGCFRCGREAHSKAMAKYTNYDQVESVMTEKHKGTYTYPESNKEIYESGPNGLRRKITIVCKVHGPFKMTPASHIIGRSCRTCQYEKKTITPEAMIDRFDTIHGRSYMYDMSEYRTVESHIIMKHLECGKIFRRKVKKHLEGQSCKRCIVSKGELKHLYV